MAEARLRIAIDGREMRGRATGVGRYLSQILNCWSDVADRHEFIIVTPGLGESRPENRIQWIFDGSNSDGSLWEQWHLPRVLRRLRPDVLFAPAYTSPLLSPCPVVQTIHDVSFFAHPEWFSWREGMRRRWITRASARRAAAVLTVSEFSRGEIARYIGIPAGQIVVAPNGPPTIVQSPSAPRQRLVLFAGSLLNRRRIPDMIAAFADATADLADARLVFVGDNRTAPHMDPRQLADAAGIGSKFEWMEYTDEVTLAEKYGSARVFLFLSDYEGFAITPLEAIAHGVPAILLDTPVGREIYGGAARFVPPNRALIAGALRELLTDDRAHAVLAHSSRAVLDRFSWKRTADVVLATIEQAAR